MGRLLHGVRRPQAHVLAALKRVNPNLDCRWNDRRGRWVIYERTRSGHWEPDRVLEDNETGAYVEFDLRAVEAAARGNTWRKARGVYSILDMLEDRERQAEEERKKERREVALDTAEHLEKHIFSGHLTFDFGRGSS